MLVFTDVFAVYTCDICRKVYLKLSLYRYKTLQEYFKAEHGVESGCKEAGQVHRCKCEECRTAGQAQDRRDRKRGRKK